MQPTPTDFTRDVLDRGTSPAGILLSVLRVSHRTVYRYRRPVVLGPHRLMCRPRDSHDLRLLDTGLTITPQPSELRWMHDVFGNSIAIATFADSAAELVFESTFRAEHFPLPPRTLAIDGYAAALPLSYSAAEAMDLGSCKSRHYADPEHRLDAWVRRLLDRTPGFATLDVLMAMNGAIKSEFAYMRREEVGVQTPLQTLELGAGSCRDFAVFMMDAVRCLGIAAQFVSGYLYDEALLDAGGGLVGGGATHAWIQVYLPGVGWVEFDPTNALVGGRNLIRVAVAREAEQAAPLAGSFTGAADDFLELQVAVEVMAE
ncbi:MAG TPA: transglutaminase family protein [Steroidobacteraceae bacterium]|nr:transglutaminase family protein [Steroidobacteraceae bacterium]